MPSRINIGPENGPYVAINESSGNLQLEDNSGNVVAEWDETNAQWDFANNTLNNVDALNSNSVNTENLDNDNGKIICAGNMSGSDPDARLDNAIAGANRGDRIILESANYSKERTGSDAIDKRCFLQGIGHTKDGGSQPTIQADWEIAVPTAIENIRLENDAGLITSSNEMDVKNIQNRTNILIQGDTTLLSHISSFGDVTFASGTESGEIGIKSGNLSVTDNGNNRIL